MSDLAAFVVLWGIGWLLLWRIPVPVDASDQRMPVTFVVPARDEVANVPELLRTLLPQLGAGDEVLVVDDHSTDGTATAARAAGAQVVPAPPLPAGWSGKQWACHTGAGAASNAVLVFLDADARLEPGGAARVASLARRPGLTSVQPFHLVPSPGEQLAAFFNVVAMMGTLACTPLGPRVRPRGAFGPCLVTSTSDYRDAGGHAAVPAGVLDDVALAAAYHRAGLPVQVLGGRGTIAFRMYPGGARALVAGFTKNVAAAAVAITPGPALAVAGWLAACVAPAVLVDRLPGWAAAACYVAVVVQLAVHLRRLGSFSPLAALAYPVALAVFLAVFVRSAAVTLGRGRVSWKGRSVPTRG